MVGKGARVGCLEAHIVDQRIIRGSQFDARDGLCRLDAKELASDVARRRRTAEQHVVGTIDRNRKILFDGSHEVHSGRRRPGRETELGSGLEVIGAGHDRRSSIVSRTEDHRCAATNR
jgi:hypothetical protein